MSYPHRVQAALRLDCIVMVVKGNESVSYLDRGQAAVRRDWCIVPNKLAPTLNAVKPQCD